MASAAISYPAGAAPATAALTAAPLLVKLVALFVFFLPLKSVEIPSVVAGFSINPARMFITLAVLTAAAEACLGLAPRRTWRVARGAANPFVVALLAYFLLGILYYYVSLSFGNTLLFGSGDAFFRSWKGRPVAQYISILTYGVAPYYLIRRFAQNADHRKVIERALIASITLLIVYGIFQQLSFHAGLPVTGRLLYEGGGASMRIPAYSVGGGVTLLRFYSLGGEPRDYGTFMVGGALLYAWWHHARPTLPARALLAAIAVSVLLTASATTYLTAALTAAVLFVNMVLQRRLSLRVVVGAVVCGALVAGAVVYGNAAVVAVRVIEYWTLFSASFGRLGENTAELLVSQSVDLGGIYYVLTLPGRAFHEILFGHGFANYNTGMVAILNDYFGYDLRTELMFEDTRSYAIKLLVEGGLVGVGLYLMMFVYTLRQTTQLSRAAATAGVATTRIWLMRAAYVAFFIANLMQISYYHFLVMGLIAARYARMREDTAATAPVAAAG